MVVCVQGSLNWYPVQRDGSDEEGRRTSAEGELVGEKVLDAVRLGLPLVDGEPVVEAAALLVPAERDAEPVARDGVALPSGGNGVSSRAEAARSAASHKPARVGA